VFKDLAVLLMQCSNKKLRKEGKEVIRLLDSSSLPLKGDAYGWSREEGVTLQGLKLHIEYDLLNKVPVRSEITNARSHDFAVAKEWELETSCIYVFDRGYNCYNWWDKIINIKSDFVTRLHKKAKVDILSSRVIGKKDEECGILRDEVVRVGHKTSKNKRTGRHNRNNLHQRRLRRVVVRRDDKDTDLVLITNNLKLPAQRIAYLYKKRWEIELYFKWIKQKLKIKKFIGHSENAVKIQIYATLIAHLLVSTYRQITKMTKLSLTAVSRSHKNNIIL
jgi:hypothetical protein